MTAKESRSILDRATVAIEENIRGFYAGMIDYAEFSRRSYALHDAIARAGQRGTFARRWRSAYPFTAR